MLKAREQGVHTEDPEDWKLHNSPGRTEFQYEPVWARPEPLFCSRAAAL